MTDREWIAGFARGLEMEPPGDEEYEALLELAATAAHASERTAAPIACFMAGLTGRPLAELNGIAEQVAPGG